MKPDKTSRASFTTPKILLTMNLKKQLNIYLKTRDLTASQLSKKSGVPKQSLSGWLAGSNPRDVKQVKRVADVLGTTVDHLMFGDGVQKQEVSVPLDSLVGEEWMTGLFEIKIRRVKR